MRTYISAAAVSLLLIATPVFAQSTDVQAQIAALQAQIQQLLQVIAQLKGQSTTPVQCLDLKYNFGLDDTDSNTNGEVSKLQGFLVSQGLLNGSLPKGYFGLATMRALQAWQKQKGIAFSGDPDSTGYGFVGKKTRAALACKSDTSTPIQCPHTGTDCSVGFHSVLNGTDANGCQRPVTCVPDTQDGSVTNGKVPVPMPTTTTAPCILSGQTIANGVTVTAYLASYAPLGSNCDSQVRICTNGVLSGSAMYQYLSCSALKKTVGPVTSTPVVGAAPIPPNSKCFWYQNRGLAECATYYESPDSFSALACPQFYNPVYDSNGTFYPSACWAERLGVKAGSYTYGYSEKFLTFMRSLWASQGYNVPNPDVEFSYQGSGLVGWKNGTFLRSVLWTSPTTYTYLDYNISTDSGPQLSPVLNKSSTMISAVGTKPKVLLAFVMFDNAYPEQTLLDWTMKYQTYVNDYISKKEQVANPIQYNFYPVVIMPPSGVSRPSTSHTYFTPDEMRAIFTAATQKLGQSSFQIFALAPVFLNGFGGYYQTWNGMEFIEAPLHPQNIYSATNQQDGLNALAAFQSMFLTISHEILHAVGLNGDHIPMGYGTYFLDTSGLNVDHVTGKYLSSPPSDCDFLGTSPDFYSVDLPVNLQIRVGQEPSWLTKTASNSGPCLSGLYNNAHLKDSNNDGAYEIMYSNNLIGKELQGALRWIDIDGDGVAELVDPNPYGGFTSTVPSM